MATTEHTPRLRAGDADRDEVLAQLRGHHEAGRLTAEEFEERMGTALVATWLDELPPLLHDLPSERSGPGATADAGRVLAVRRGRGRLPLPVLLAPFLLTFAALASIGAVTHGHFPWPLVWLGLAMLWLRRRGTRPPAWARERWAPDSYR